MNSVVKNPVNEKYKFKPTDAALMADITFVSKDSLRYKAMPLVMVDDMGILQIDDTVYAQNLFVKFIGVGEGKKVRIGIKESETMIDFVTVKAYIFPYINLVWLGLIIMVIGILMSMIKRAGFSVPLAAAILIFAGAAMSYMFLFAN